MCDAAERAAQEQSAWSSKHCPRNHSVNRVFSGESPLMLAGSWAWWCWIEAGTTRRHKPRRWCSKKARVRSSCCSLVRHGLHSWHSTLSQAFWWEQETLQCSGNTITSFWAACISISSRELGASEAECTARPTPTSDSRLNTTCSYNRRFSLKCDEDRLGDMLASIRWTLSWSSMTKSMRIISKKLVERG